MFNKAAIAVTTPGATDTFLAVTRAPRLALTDHDDPTDTRVIVTVGTAAVRRTVDAALVRAGSAGDRDTGVVGIADPLAVPLGRLLDDAAAPTTEEWPAL